MAKIKKRKLCWEASASSQVVGYKLYWSRSGAVDYASESAPLGNVTQVVLPDDVDTFEPADGPVEFGVAAVDELGNESDLITFTAPYQFSVPRAPEDLRIENLKEQHDTTVRSQETGQSEPIPLFDKQVVQLDEPVGSGHVKGPMIAMGSLKYQHGYEEG